jgi:glutamine amidotransferase
MTALRVTMTSKSNPRVGIVDYQAGNLHSIANAFEHLGAKVRPVHRNDDVDGCSHLVLPGVGAFGFCAERLEHSGLTGVVKAWALVLRRPLLGICVGMQLLADGSEESPGAPGLGWIGGQVRVLQRGTGTVVRVPHVGWNTVTFTRDYGEFRKRDEADCYFDHSFAYTDPSADSTLATCQHGICFSAAVQRDNIVAVQFHPEKSQTAGMRFLRGFLAS